jgi:hypothetical protein
MIKGKFYRSVVVALANFSTKKNPAVALDF